jgi:hypothetical protein
MLNVPQVMLKVPNVMLKVPHVMLKVSHVLLGPSWLWTYVCWIYNYLGNQLRSPLTLWDRILFRSGVLDTTLCDKVCQWLARGRWFSQGTPISSINKNWPPRYNWNIVESGVKHHNPNSCNVKSATYNAKRTMHI